jgi:hypothetical protein
MAVRTDGTDNQGITAEIPPGLHEIFIPLPVSENTPVELLLVQGGGDISCNDYACTAIQLEGRHAVVTGKVEIPQAVLRYLEAADFSVEYGSPSAGTLNIRAGILPGYLPPGSYILFSPAGRLGDISFARAEKPVYGRLAAAGASPLTEAVDLAGGYTVSTRIQVSGQFREIFTADGMPAAGVYADDAVRAVFMLFDPEPPFTVSPAFPVFMENAVSFLTGSTPIPEGICGKPLQIAPGEYDIFRMGRRTGTAEAAYPFVPVQPGIYRNGNETAALVNHGVPAEPFPAETGVREYGPPSAEGRGAGLPVLLTAAAVLLWALFLGLRD